MSSISMNCWPVATARPRVLTGAGPVPTATGRALPRTGSSLRVRWERVATLLLAAALVAVVALAVATRGGGVATGGQQAGAPGGDGAVVGQATALVEHTVVPGDTLWAIATTVDPTADPRPMVDRIMRLNGLSSGDVALGDVLLVPAHP